MIITIFDILGLVFGILGAVYVGKKMRIGFLLFFIGSASHAIVGYYSARYGLVATNILFIFIDMYWYVQWGKSDK